MKSIERFTPKPVTISLSALLACAAGAPALATEPCGDFGECKALIEINASDGDIGFHFLMDGDDLVKAHVRGPDGKILFRDKVQGAFAEQKITETFAESAEPLCWDDPDAEEGEDIVTLEEFLELWDAGTYKFHGKGEGGEGSHGETELTYDLPAAPADVDFDGSSISWSPGLDLGNCANYEGDNYLGYLIGMGLIPDPATVPVAAWEVVLEPDVDDGDPTGSLTYTVRVPGDISPMAVSVPADYLASLPDDTPVKVEVGAVGIDDNATFTEEDGFCVNEDEGCED